MTKRKYNSGNWTKAKFEAWIKNGLRRLNYRWPPRYEAVKKARVDRGIYMCKGYKRRAHRIKTKEMQLDHIIPVIDPKTGHTSWDKYINRLFCESNNFQILCLSCHKKKTKEERKS